MVFVNNQRKRTFKAPLRFQMNKESPGMKTPRLEIIEQYCKGCSICVEFCPTNVLEMDGFLAKVVRPEACIACMQCELRCPDFAIKVHKD